MGKMRILLILAGVFASSLSINVTNTRYRQFYHIQPPGGWMNDPNGLSYFNGQYHAFFQYNPDSSNPGAAHWGHVVSTDLVHWKYLPIALSPDQPYDKDGCWSGSAVVNNGVLTLIYAGNVNNPFKQTINIATSTDGINFTKYPGNPVIATPPIDGSSTFKDPKVWSYNNAWYASICNPTSLPRAVLYQSSDLKTWTNLGALAEATDISQNLGNIWDDPNFFEINGKFVFWGSATGIKYDNYKFTNLQQTIYTIGDFDYDMNFFNHSGLFYELDQGHDFFSAQFFKDPQDRVIAMGWMYGGGSYLDEITEQQYNWAGTLSIPRLVTLSQDGTRVQMTPIGEMALLRGSQYVNSPITINGNFDPRISCNATEVILNITIEQVTGRKVGMNFGPMSLYYDLQLQKLILLRGKDIRQVDLKNINQVNLHVFLDKSSVEVFANNGAATLSSRYYADPAPGLSLFAELRNGVPGTANVHLQAWSLNNIY